MREMSPHSRPLPAERAFVVQLHVEAARLLSFSEEEFSKTLEIGGGSGDLA